MSRRKSKPCPHCGHKQTPENQEYAKLKGQMVRVYRMGVTSLAQAVVGRLVWVDVYTIGVARNPQDYPERVSIIYKHGIQIEPVPMQE